jgi:hypothetical protein
MKHSNLSEANSSLISQEILHINMFYYKQFAQKILLIHTYIRDYSNIFHLFLMTILREHWYTKDVYAIKI